LTLLSSVATAAAIIWVRSLPVAFVANGQVYPAGRSYDGDPLPRSHPLLVRAAYQGETVAPNPTDAPRDPRSALLLRQGCAWGEPGRNPYRGTVEQALAAMRLPPRVADAFATQIRSHARFDRVEIGKDSIQGVGTLRQFDPKRVAMTYGDTLCIGTQVHFKPGHVEAGDLYQVVDLSGRSYTVMVPDVCGNIALVRPVGDQGDGGGDVNLLSVGDGADFGDGGLGPGFAMTNADMLGFVGSGGSRDVPEPSSLSVALLGLGALAWVRHGTRRPARALSDDAPQAATADAGRAPGDCGG
jgi:hypothetical protein